MLENEKQNLSLSEYQLQLLILAINMADIPYSLQKDYEELRKLLYEREE